jgi:hypothetical protein
MIARGFKSVLWVATVGTAALGCYMVTLRVATERNELAKVERQIVAAKREIRSLQTELGTRGRLSQLEHWNAEVLALSAPGSSQFLKSEVTLARFETRQPGVAERAAEVRLASLDTQTSAPAPARQEAAPRPVQAVAPAPQAPAAPVVRRASFTTAAAPAPVVTAAAKTPTPAKKASAAATPETKKAPATATAEPKKARLGSALAAEIGAAARSESKGSGGN